MKLSLITGSFIMLLLSCGMLAGAQTNNYFGTSGTLSGNVWSTNAGGPYTSALNTTGGAIINFGNNTTSITGGSITVYGINATANATITTIGGTISNFNNGIVTIDVASGKLLDFSTNSMTTSATAGYIKNGTGALALGGGTFGGGFTLNAGTIVARGVNAMGAGTSGTLTINGGTIAGSAARDFTGKYPGGITVGGDFTLGSGTTPAVTTANLTFSNNMALGSSVTRTITIGGTGTYTLGGIISGTSSNLTIASTAAGTIVLTAANTYSGTTTVNGGTLQLNRTGGGTLPSTSNIVVNGGTLKISTNQTVNNLTVASGASLIVDAGVTLTVNGTYSVSSTVSGNSGTIITNGTLKINEGGWPGNTGTFTYGASSTLEFANTSSSYGVNSGDTWWPATNGPVNVNVSGSAGITMNVARTVSGLFQTSSGVTNANNLTLNGTGKLNSGGFFASIPVWGASSTLIYNTGGTFGRGNEFPNAGNLPSNVQVSGNTTVNYPNAGLAARTITGDLTIDAGSALYMDYGSPNPGVGTLTVKSVVLNGSLSLGSQTGGDLVVKGDFTRTGTLFPNSRAVFFNAATGNQTITGATTFDYVIVDKAAGNVVLANDITVSQVLTLTNGLINTSSNKVVLSSSSASALARTNGYVNGNLQRAVATGTNTYLYAVGTTTGYAPASFAFNSVGTGGNITVATTDGVGPNYPSSLNATKKLGRYWSATNSGVAGYNTTTSSATFTYLTSPSDLLGGASSSNLKAYVYSGGSASYAVSNSNTSGSFTLNGFSNIGEFGAGECKGTLAPTFVKTMASSCGGGADGTITVTPAGGTSPYTYSWTSNPSGFTSTSAAITGLSPRDYTVVVTEATTCSATIQDITIWQALAPTITHSGTSSSACGNTGSIIVYAANGVAPFTYSLNGTTYQAGSTFTNLAAGTYTIYVKDLRGCVSTKPNVVVSGASPIVVTSYATAASSCANNGSIQLFRTGGTGPYTYSLDDVTYQGSNVFTNLAGNANYTGWVKDSKGCKSSLANIFVGKATAISVTQTHTNTSACASNGTISLTGAGGVPPYTYSITGAAGPYQSGNSFTGVAAGSYTAWIQDSKGCKANVGVTISSDAPIVVTATASDAGGCNNAGKIQLFRTGGVGPYTYSLDNVTYQSSNTFTGLASGTYTGYVKDSKTCVGSLANITVTANTAALSVTAGSSASSSCVNDGTIQLRAAGGVAPYTYSIDNVTYQSGATFTGVAAGTYTGYVKDVNNCSASVSVTVAGNSITVTAYAVSASDCEVSNGSIQLFRTGGTGPYTYSIDGTNYVAGNTFTNLTAGTYTGYVKDSKGCVGTLASIVVGPNNCLPPIAATKNAAAKAGGVNTAVKVQAYPNPSVSEFTLSLSGFAKGKVSITIVDMMGRKVGYAETSNSQYRFGSNLRAGIYNVLVQQGDLKQSIKLVKE